MKSSTVKRRALKALGALFTFTLVCIAFPHVVAAQVVFDPTTAANGVIGGFLSTSQAWGYDLYVALMVFDIAALAIAALLFRDNLGELISGVALKIVVGSIFIYFVVSAGTFFPGIVNGFTHAGQQAGGTSNSTPTQLLLVGAAASAGYFIAADAAHSADETAATAVGICDPPVVPCLIGPTLDATNGHYYFILICNALGMITILAFVGMFLTYVLITLESYIVIFAGVFYLGFAGSKFTAPFAQGYLNYMISVGTKLFTMYLVMGIVVNLLPGMLLGVMGTVLAASVVPGGFGTIAVIGTAAFAALQTLTAAALIYAIPQYAAAFLSGQSGASGNAFLGQIASSTSGMQMMLNGFKGASMGGAERQGNALTEQHLHHGAVGQAGQIGGIGSSAAHETNHFASMNGGSASATAPTTANNLDSSAVGSGGGGLGSIGSVNGSGSGNSTSAPAIQTTANNVSAGSVGGGGGGLGSIGSVSGNSNGNSGGMRSVTPPAAAQTPPPPQVAMGGDPVFSQSSGNQNLQDAGAPSAVVWNKATNSFQSSAVPGLSGGGVAHGQALPNDPARLQAYAERLSQNTSASDRNAALDAARATRFDEMSDESMQVIAENPELRSIVQEAVDERRDSLELQRDMQTAMGLQGLAMAVPRDSAPPTAAQIRLSNPDRL